jgi:hypothetical protein
MAWILRTQGKMKARLGMGAGKYLITSVLAGWLMLGAIAWMAEAAFAEAIAIDHKTKLTYIAVCQADNRFYFLSVFTI